MSANIVVNSLALASNGKTLTGTLAGGTGSGYAPASGVTGLTPKKTGGNETCQIAVASATISGTTLTITLAVPMGSTQTVTLDVAGASNLTDGGGTNTAQGQTAVAVTNSSTKSMAELGYHDANFFGFGQPLDQGAYSRYLQGSGFVTTVTGTDAGIHIFDGQTITVVVDDGSPVTVTAASGGFFLCSAFTGLSDAPHKVEVRAPSDNVVHNATALVVTGAAAAISATAGYAKSIIPNDATLQTNSSYDGGLLGGIGPYAQTIWWRDTGIWRFAAQCSAIRIVTFDTIKVRLITDGIAGSVTTIGAGGEWRLSSVATGLDNTARHEYQIEFLTINKDHYVVSLMVDGGGVAAVAHPALTKYWAWFGDSITAGDSSDIAYGYQSFPYLVAKAKNVGLIQYGISGRTVSQMKSDTANVTGRLQVPAAIWINGGTNDSSQNSPVATFQADYVTMLRNIRSAVPAATKIFCQRLFSDSVGQATGPSGSTTYNQAIAAAVAVIVADGTVTGGANTSYVDVSSWNPDLTGVHPTIAGSITIAGLMEPIMDPRPPFVPPGRTGASMGVGVGIF